MTVTPSARSVISIRHFDAAAAVVSAGRDIGDPMPAARPTAAAARAFATWCARRRQRDGSGSLGRDQREPGAGGRRR